MNYFAMPGINKPSKAMIIMNLVSDYYGVSELQIKSRRKPSQVVKARQMFVYLTYRVMGCGYPVELTKTAIGKLIDRDHSSVIHSIKVVESECDTYPKNKEELNYLLTKIKQNELFKESSRNTN